MCTRLEGVHNINTSRWNSHCSLWLRLRFAGGSFPPMRGRGGQTEIFDSIGMRPGLYIRGHN